MATSDLPWRVTVPSTVAPGIYLVITLLGSKGDCRVELHAPGVGVVSSVDVARRDMRGLMAVLAEWPL